MKRYVLLFVIITFLSVGGCAVYHGRISMATEPAGADVYINGVKVGTTPTTFEHDWRNVKKMEIHYNGYYPVQETLNWGWIHNEIANGNGTDRTKGEYQGDIKTIWIVRTQRTLLLKPKEEAHLISTPDKEKERLGEKPRLAYIPKTVTVPEVSLRKEPKHVLEKDIRKMMSTYGFYDDNLNPAGSFANDFVDNGNSTVTDRRTGLMWQWSGSSRVKSWKRVRTYVKQLNRSRFAGYSDWRLPTVEELASLLRKDKSNGRHIDSLFDKRQARCWSSDEGPLFMGRDWVPQAWYVNFLQGTIGLTIIGTDPTIIQVYNPSHHYVRAVRLAKKSAQVKPSGMSSGEQEGIKLVRQKVEKVSLRKEPKQLFERDIRQMLATYDFYDGDLNLRGSFANDFVDNGNSTVTDRRTGLMWQKGGSSRAKTWHRGGIHVKQLNRSLFAGYSDWRLPTIDELASLVEREKANGVHIDPIFYNTQKSCWSADKGPVFGGSTQNPPQVWHVNFREGSLGLTVLPFYHAAVPTRRYVRAVRSLR